MSIHCNSTNSFDALTVSILLHRILELDTTIKIPKTEKYVFSFDTPEDELFDFDDTLDSTPKTYSCPKCKISFNRKSSLVDHTCSYDNYFETDISLYENAEYPIICDTVDDSTDQFSLRKSKK